MVLLGVLGARGSSVDMGGTGAVVGGEEASS